MENVASRYGLALYSLAFDLNQVDEYENEMKMFREIFHENEEFLNILNSSFLTQIERKKILKDTLKGCEENILNFFNIIIDNNRVMMIPSIIDAFITYCNDSKGIKEGYIYSVNELDKKQIEEITNKISKIEKKNIYLTNRLDKSLIGGVKVIIGEHVYDGSIKHQYEKMKIHLLNKEDVKDED